MASENNLKNKIMQTTSRQKFIMVFIVVVMLIIIWQIIGLIGGGTSSSPSPAIKPIAKIDPNAPKNMSSPQALSSAGTTTAAAPKPINTKTTESHSALMQGSIANDPQFIRMQRITEEKYMGKLNELEELRIQRQIAETNQAISAAKLATVTAEKDISELLTRPAQQNLTTYPGQPEKNSADIPPPGSTTVSNISIPPPPEQVLPYKLISVSMLLNKWSAVISFQGTMYTVSVGDMLPPDSSVVTSISKNSITIRKDGKSRRIGITTSI